MLSEKEKCECKQILNFLTDEDIFGLVRTLSNQAVKVYSRAEAEHAILSFSESALDFLNRRKVNKEVLIKYCLTAFIHVSPSDSKSKVVDAIIHKWAETAQRESTHPHQNFNESSSSRVFMQAPHFERNTQQVNVVQNIINVGSIHETRNNILNVSGMPSPDNTEQINSEAFVKWYYEMLNASHPSMAHTSQNFGPHHFWDNAQLFLYMVAAAQKEEENICGGDKVAERLLLFPKVSQILFNPNVSGQGVTVTTSSHGTKLISVCGTLHTATDCVGIFQQSFALVNNPLSPGSWKVKVTCLKMDQCPAHSLPKLEECPEIRAIETHTMLVVNQSLQLGSP